MLRSIVAVIGSYILMAILIMGSFAGMLFGMGPERLLEPGTWKGNWFLCIAAPSITVVVGVLGGWLCAKIARSRTPVIVLAGIVLVLGALTAFSTMQKPEPTGPREPGTTLEQFLEKGREPTWLLIFQPLGGAAAVLIGGLLLAGAPKPKNTP